MLINPGAETCSRIAIRTSSLKSVNSISETRQAAVEEVELLHFRLLLLARNRLLRELLQRLRFVLSRFITLLLFRLLLLLFVADGSMSVVWGGGVDETILLSLRLAVIERVIHLEKPCSQLLLLLLLSSYLVLSSSFSSSVIEALPSNDNSSTRTIINVFQILYSRRTKKKISFFFLSSCFLLIINLSLQINSTT